MIYYNWKFVPFDHSYTHFIYPLFLASAEAAAAKLLQSCLTLCGPIDGSPPGSPPLLLLPSIFPIIKVFSNQSALSFRWPKYWSFSFSISPSNEYSGLISFRMDWLGLLAVQGTLKSLQHHSAKASILRCSAFFYSPTLLPV